MKKNLILLIFLLGFGLMMNQCATNPDDMIEGRRRKNGSYYFVHTGSRVWVHRSFREGSMAGGYRGGGPRAGK